MASSPSNIKKARARTRTIAVDQLNKGDVIVARWADGEFITIPEIKVNSIGSCQHNWRTHVHVNRTQCWDIRSLVEVKA